MGEVGGGEHDEEEGSKRTLFKLCVSVSGICVCERVFMCVWERERERDFEGCNY